MKKKFKVIYSILFFLAIIGMSYGYAALNQELSISGEAYVRVDKDVRIAGINLSGYTGNAISTYEDYSVNETKMGIKLPESSSSITYKVKVINKKDNEVGILKINGLPENLEYKLENYNLKEPICENDKCTNGIEKEIIITIKNKEGYSDPTKIYNLNLEYEFKDFYNIEYDEEILKYITDNPVKRKVIMNDGVLINVKLNSIDNIKVKMGNLPLEKNKDYTFSNNILKINNVADDIFLSYKEESDEEDIKEFRTKDLLLTFNTNGWQSNGRSFYQYNFTLENIGSEDVASWNIKFKVPENTEIVGGWSTDYCIKDGYIILKKLPNISILRVNQSISFGIQFSMEDSKFKIRSTDMNGEKAGYVEPDDSDNPENPYEPVKPVQKDLKIEFKSNGRWGSQGNYFVNYEINITNNSDKDKDYWIFEFDLPEDGIIQNSWNCETKLNGKTVIVTPANHNNNIGKGETVSIGMIIMSPIENYNPTIK